MCMVSEVAKFSHHLNAYYLWRRHHEQRTVEAVTMGIEPPSKIETQLEMAGGN